MSTRSLIIDGNSFQDNITRLEEKVNLVADTIDLINNNMKLIDGTNDVWKSDTAVEMHNDYLEIQKSLDSINVECVRYFPKRCS